MLKSSDIFIWTRGHAGIWAQMLGSEFHKFQHEGGLTKIRADSLTLPSALLGRVVSVLNRLDVGVAPPRRARHELDGVHDAGTSKIFSPQLVSSVVMKCQRRPLVV